MFTTIVLLSRSYVQWSTSVVKHFSVCGLNNYHRKIHCNVTKVLFLTTLWNERRKFYVIDRRKTTIKTSSRSSFHIRCSTTKNARLLTEDSAGTTTKRFCTSLNIQHCSVWHALVPRGNKIMTDESISCRLIGAQGLPASSRSRSAPSSIRAIQYDNMQLETFVHPCRRCVKPVYSPTKLTVPS